MDLSFRDLQEWASWIRVGLLRLSDELGAGVAARLPTAIALAESGDYGDLARLTRYLFSVSVPRAYPRLGEQRAVAVGDPDRLLAEAVRESAPWLVIRSIANLALRPLPLTEATWRPRWGPVSLTPFRAMEIRRPHGGMESNDNVVHGDAAVVTAEYDDMAGQEVKIGIGHLRFCFVSTEGRSDGSLLGSYLSKPRAGENEWRPSRWSARSFACPRASRVASAPPLSMAHSSWART